MSIQDGLGNIIGVISKGLSSPLTSFAGLPGGIGQAIAGSSNFKGIQDAIVLASAVVPTSQLPGAGFNYHVLNGMSSRRDPLMNYCWFAEFPTIGRYKMPWNYVEEFTAPLRSLETLDQYRRGKVFHFAGQHSISNISAKFYDDSTGLTQAYLEAWREKVIGLKGTYNYPINYKKNVTVTILDITRMITVYIIKYIGCWPSTPEGYNLTSAASDRTIAGQEFSVDDLQFTAQNISAPNLANAIFSSLNNFPQGLIDQLTGANGSTSSQSNGLFSTGNAATLANLI